MAVLSGAWQFCREHDWAAEPQKRAQNPGERPHCFSALARRYLLCAPQTAMLLGLPNFTAELLKKATSVSYHLLNDLCETEPERENQR